MNTRFLHLPEIGPEPGLLLEIFEGPLEVHDIIDLFAAEIAAGVRRPGMRAIADYRGAIVEASAHQLQELAHWVIDHAEYMRGARWAVVVDDAAVTRVSSRVAESTLPAIGAQSRSFESLAEACGWLGVPWIDPREAAARTGTGPA